MAAVFTCLSFILQYQAVNCHWMLVDRPCVSAYMCVCVCERERWDGVTGWAMDVQSIMAAHGSGEGEVVSEESALFEYSRSIIRTRAAQRLSGCRRRPERLPPLGREQCADREGKKKDAWGSVRVLSFRGFRGSTVSKRRWLWSVVSCCYGDLLYFLFELKMRRKGDHSTVWK